MTDQLSELSSFWQYGPQKSIVYLANDNKEGKVTDKDKGASDFSDIKNPLKSSPFKPGDILLSTLDLHLNSDKPGPVLSTVIAGPFKGSKVIGGFERRGESLVVEYTSITTPNGETYAIKAYAINPAVPEAYIADAVDNHYLERWGGLVAASFLEGFADATQNSGVSTITTAGSSLTNASAVTTFPQYSLAEKSIIAGGKVAERLGDIMAKKFDRPPTVEAFPTHKKGEPVGILIIK
nr:DotG/IcmE/VirB10 family protein [Methylomarinum sp. Ch1-1]MDP4523184.1 DotG/IcmE/VirB10 family protein [Methylomarinum sp. Ch1-1]